MSKSEKKTVKKPVELPDKPKNAEGKRDYIAKGLLTLPEIKNALYDTFGNISKAVKQMGISLTVYYEYRQKYPEILELEKQAFKLRCQELKETAIESLINVANAPNVDHQGMYPTNLAPAKVKASETLLKLAGELKDKENNNENSNNSPIAQLVNLFTDMRVAKKDK